MMAHPIAPDYGQQFIFPPALEDWVPAGSSRPLSARVCRPARFAGAGLCHAPAAEGRPPYAPSLLLKIWLYGYFHRIRSTRKLEAACREQLSLLWLTGSIHPDHNSLGVSGAITGRPCARSSNRPCRWPCARAWSAWPCRHWTAPKSAAAQQSPGLEPGIYGKTFGRVG